MTLRSSEFRAPWWLRNAHLQTLWGPLLRRHRPRPELRRETVELPDGDFLHLDWAVTGSGPLLLVLHGLEGSSNSAYARGLLDLGARLGWRTAVMHFRGCSGPPNRLPRGYHSGDTSDLDYVIRVLRERFSGEWIGLAGFSLGGNVLLKWLGERGADAGVDAAVAVSVPFLLDQAAWRMNRGFSRIYQAALLGSLKRRLIEKHRQHGIMVIEPGRLARLDSFRSFDDHVTAPLHGFRGADDYYRQASSRAYLARIRVPTLILHALDDPFMTPAVVPEQGELSDAVVLELSSRGGHVGFVFGTWPWRCRYWIEERVLAYFSEISRPPGQIKTLR